MVWPTEYDKSEEVQCKTLTFFFFHSIDFSFIHAKRNKNSGLLYNSHVVWHDLTYILFHWICRNAKWWIYTYTYMNISMIQRIDTMIFVLFQGHYDFIRRFDMWFWRKIIKIEFYCNFYLDFYLTVKCNSQFSFEFLFCGKKKLLCNSITVYILTLCWYNICQQWNNIVFSNINETYNKWEEK